MELCPMLVKNWLEAKILREDLEEKVEQVFLKDYACFGTACGAYNLCHGIKKTQ